MSTFKVGELAELVYSRFGNVGSECTVVEGLAGRLNKLTRMRETGYIIDVNGTRYLALPDQLRKKRPPQDWVTLCNLLDTPVDAPRELETA